MTAASGPVTPRLDERRREIENAVARALTNLE